MRLHRARRLLLVAVLTALGLAYLGAIGWMFVDVYDFPFRRLGRFEKSLDMAGRCFAVCRDDGTILFGRNRPGHGAIVVLNPRSGGRATLVSGTGFHGDPAASPDGRLVAYTRETGKCGHVWLVGRDGSNARQLTTGSAYDWSPVFAPDGESIWFKRVPQGTQSLFSRLCVVSLRDGSVQAAEADKVDEEVTFAATAPVGFLSEPADDRSAPGRSLDRILRLDPRTGQTTLIGNGWRAAAAPSGRNVAFLGGYAELWTMGQDGTDRHRVYGSASSKHSVGWTRDENGLVFMEETRRGFVLSTVSLEGSHYTPLLNLTSP